MHAGFESQIDGHLKVKVEKRGLRGSLKGEI